MLDAPDFTFQSVWPGKASPIGLEGHGRGGICSGYASSCTRRASLGSIEATSCHTERKVSACFVSHSQHTIEHARHQD